MTGEPILRRWSRKLRTVPSDLAEMGQRVLDYLSVMSIRSDQQIDVLIPAAAKDMDILPHCIDGIRQNVKHPIARISIIARTSSRVRDLCDRKKCTLVDERSLLDMDPQEIHLVVNGVDRSTWIYQQFLKWSGDSLAQGKYYLVVDADTVFVRPQVFERDGKIIFNYSDEYHVPYFQMYNRLLGELPIFPSSFVCHQMLFDCAILGELKARIENAQGCGWREGILRNLDRNEWSGFSDYDTYGHYVFLHYPRTMAIEYWFNLGLKRGRGMPNAAIMTLKYGGKYKSVSFHSWTADARADGT
jgi:hypothetical protein